MMLTRNEACSHSQTEKFTDWVLVFLLAEFLPIPELMPHNSSDITPHIDHQRQSKLPFCNLPGQKTLVLKAPNMVLSLSRGG